MTDQKTMQTQAQQQAKQHTLPHFVFAVCKTSEMPKLPHADVPLHEVSWPGHASDGSKVTCTHHWDR